MKRPAGMAQRAFTAWIAACFDAKISPDRIGQRIGNAPASKGYHKRDGKDEFGFNYCAAVDIKVKDLTPAQIVRLLNACASHGFIGWFRDWDGNEHAHLVFVALKMKPALQAQVHEYFADGDGLVGNTPNRGYQATQKQETKLRAAFLHYNPAN